MTARKPPSVPRVYVSNKGKHVPKKTTLCPTCWNDLQWSEAYKTMRCPNQERHDFNKRSKDGHVQA